MKLDEIINYFEKAVVLLENDKHKQVIIQNESLPIIIKLLKELQMSRGLLELIVADNECDCSYSDDAQEIISTRLD